MSEADNVVYREEQAAGSLRWWQRLTGDRVVYWAASPHTANAPHLRLTRPGDTDMRFASAGSQLRAWYGRRYLSIGFTFDHGSVMAGPGETVDVGRPATEWFEAPLGDVPHTTFVLDLRRHRRTPLPVRAWLHEPVTTRGLPQAGPGAIVDGGSLSQWFDLLVHTQVVHPAGAT
jgi:erythromycin esterase